MAIIISKCPNQYGIYKVPLGFLKMRLAEKFTGDEVAEAVAFLAADGAIKLYRNDTIAWLVNKFDREHGLTPNNRNHCMAVRDELRKFPEIREPFLSRYHDYAMGIASLSDSDSMVEVSSDPDPDPDPETETEKNNTESKQKRTIRYYKAEMADDDLAQLEQQCGWSSAWKLYKDASTKASNNSKRTVKALETDLRDLLAKQQKYGLDNKAMTYGIDESVRRDKYNVNYVIAAAQGYNPFKGMDKDAYYGDKREPLPPMQPGKDDVILETSNEQ